MADQLSAFAQTIYKQKYSLDGREEWDQTAERVASNVMGALGYKPLSDETRRIQRYIEERKFMPGGRYLYASGRDLHQVQNCLLLRCEDSREGWSDLFWKAGSALMTGAGIGVDYSEVRAAGSPVARTGGLASGPLSPMRIVNEIGRDVMQGGSRRSAIWAGLRWDHPDAMAFVRVKDWRADLRELKEKDPSVPMEMELTNVSVILDDDFFAAYDNPLHLRHSVAREVYWAALKRMARTGEPGFSIDTGDNAGESLRNACTEVTSCDDSDVCNLGSLNLARIESLEELKDVVDAAVLFLLAGTVYSDVPYQAVADTRALNRRLGLGLMGVHEWLLQRGIQYGPNGWLGFWLDEYARSTEVAKKWADLHDLSAPVKTRAIAPTGTIGIIGETTTGIEPVFCVAYARRYLSGGTWNTAYVIDPTAERMIKAGVAADKIEDAYVLAEDVDRRLEMQAWVQRYVDHGISSTVNLPAPLHGSDAKDFGKTVMKHLPHLRGVTVYPNGARAGQPITPVSYEQAVAANAVIEEEEERCAGGVCGI